MWGTKIEGKRQRRLRLNNILLFQIAGTVQEPLQAKDEPATPPATAVPAQFKQRTPMYNSNANTAATTPASPVPAPQAAPQAQQPPPSEKLSLTVSKYFGLQLGRCLAFHQS